MTPRGFRKIEAPSTAQGARILARRATPLQVTLGLVLVAFLNALCFPLITTGLGFAPHLVFATLRALIAGTALALLAALLRRPLPRGFRIWFTLALIGLGATTLGYLGMFHASEFVAPGLATVIANSQPLLAAALAHLFLSERLRLMQHLGLLLGFLGIIVISLPELGGPGRAGFALGLAYIVLATSGVAVGNVLMKALGGRVDPLVAMAAQSLFGAVPLAVGAMLRERPVVILWSPTFMVSLLGLALLSTALGYWLWFTLLGRVPLSRANAYTFLTPFIGYSLGVAFFGERLGLAAVIGLALTAVGIVLVDRGGFTAGRSRPLAVGKGD